MNRLERKMLDILKKGKELFNVVGVKAEFEAEGTRMDELLRLMEIVRRAGLNIGLKVGGCEAIRDLMECKQLGVDYIIAPMIESVYALEKFIDAKNKIYTAEEQQDIKFLFNLETAKAYEVLPGLVKAASAPGGVQGVVFGRVDFSLSQGLMRDSINCDQVTTACVATARACRAARQELVVGGGIAVEAVPALKQIHAHYLTRFETRKIMFAAAALDQRDIEDGLLDAVQFELFWLLNKRDYYGAIEKEDANRIQMLESRWKLLCERQNRSPELGF